MLLRLRKWGRGEGAGGMSVPLYTAAVCVMLYAHQQRRCTSRCSMPGIAGGVWQSPEVLYLG